MHQGMTNREGGHGGLLGVHQAAEYLGIGISSLYRLVWRSEITHTRMGRVLKFRQEDLDALIKTKTTTKWTSFRGASSRGDQK